MHAARASLTSATANNFQKEKIYMPRDSRRKAGEFHQRAAHAAHLAATQHGEEDHQTGHEQSRQALEHSAKAFSELQEAHQKSATTIGKANGSAEVTHAE
jgi:hypothetical protein